MNAILFGFCCQFSVLLISGVTANLLFCTSQASAQASPDRDTSVLNGIDVLRRDGFDTLTGQRVGLITNHTGISVDEVSTAKLFGDSDKVNLTALFSPEHGFKGELDVSNISDSKDETTGLRVFSLYGATRRPTPEMLDSVDTLVFDIQDIGTRFYTYVSTMGEAMIAAAQHGKRFVVLDRPNPIGGQLVSGPMLDRGAESFVGFHSLPIRHGMTIGELALMFRDELKLALDLHVVQCEQWRRSMLWDDTGLLWVNPSPNMRCLNQALLYPGVGMLETTNLSVGRGTDTPFEVVGAPWIDPFVWSAALRRSGIPGVSFVPIRFTPDSSRYENERCGGVNIIITDRYSFAPLQLGVELASTLQAIYGDQWQGDAAHRLMGNRKMLDAILAGRSSESVMTIADAGTQSFMQRRSKYLLYP